MKIRNGFVSNSSSSSFVLIGNRVDINTITNEDLESKDLHFMAITNGYEGYMHIDILDMDMLNILKEFEKDKNVKVYIVYYYNTDTHESRFNSSTIPSNATITIGEVEQGSPSDADELRSMFNGEY